MKRSLMIILLGLISITVWASVFDWERAVSLYKQGQFREALAEFQKVITEYPDHSEIQEIPEGNSAGIAGDEGQHAVHIGGSADTGEVDDLVHPQRFRRNE